MNAYGLYGGNDGERDASMAIVAQGKPGGPFWGPGRFLLVVTLLLAVSASLLVVRSWMLGLGQFAQAATVLDIIQRAYVEPTDPDELSRAAIAGMLESLQDPNSVYVPPAVAEQFRRQIIGADYVGIGVQLLRRDGLVTIVSLAAGGPAVRAGVKPGDRIVAVNGHDTRPLDTEAVAGLITGPRGEAVVLTIDRGGWSIEITIVRGDIRAESVRGLRRIDDNGTWWHALDPQLGIGYIRLSQFVDGTAQGTLRAIELARQQAGALHGLVLDLRQNPGGAIHEAVGVADLFLDGGVVVRTQGRAIPTVTLEANRGVAFDGPIVVLIDGASASGSEIVAGAIVERLQDARAVGTRTFGKASVQAVYTLPDGGTLKLTEAHYLLPSGRNLQRTAESAVWGVDPSEGSHVMLEESDVLRLAELYARLNEVGGAEVDGGIDRSDWADTSMLLNALGDPQLSAAHAALAGRLRTGQWPRVGADPMANEDKMTLLQLERAIERLRAEHERLEEEARRLRQEILERSKEPA